MALNESSGAPAAPPRSAVGGPIFHPAIYPTVLFFVGTFAIFLGERVLDVGGMRTTFTVLGVLLILAAIGIRAVRQAVRPANFRPPERTLLLLYGIGAFAVLLYFLNSDVLVGWTGRTLEQSMPRLSGVLAALWPALLLAASLPVLFVELSLFSMSRAPVIELGRVRSALLSGLSIALALIFCFSLTYVAHERDARVDFSFFRTARPGESTVKIVRALDKPVNVHLFFPPANEVREEVESYFSALARESRQLVINRWDQAIHPAKARELGVSANGVIVVAREPLREQLGIALELDRARGNLRSLDQDFQKRLLQVSRKQKVAYFTVGHDERAEGTGRHSESEADRRSSIRAMRSMLGELGFEAKELGLGEGLGTAVPADASVVLTVGPKKPFLPEEIAALQRYLDKNGRLLLALDPESGQNFNELLSGLWLEYHPVPLAHDDFYLRESGQISDKVNIGPSGWSSHASVTTNMRLGKGAPLLMPGAGYLQRKEKAGTGIVNLDTNLRTDGQTWADKNGDFTFNEGSELRASYDVVAAISKRNASAVQPEEEARVVVTADSDLFTDRSLSRNRGNQYFVVDVLRWLGGEERFSGQVSNEEDMPITHTRKENALWFYLSIFAVPAAVLGFGFVMTKKRKRRGGGKSSPRVRTGSGSPPADKPSGPPAAGSPTSEVTP
jgi:hypothetical protein